MGCTGWTASRPPRAHHLSAVDRRQGLKRAQINLIIPDSDSDLSQSLAVQLSDTLQSQAPKIHDHNTKP